MFKILALVGAIAGGTTYGLYAHTDLFDKKCGGPGCPLTTSAGVQPDAKPLCCEPTAPCCEEHPPCCSTKAAAAKPAAAPCCASKTIPVSAKAACCADPCPIVRLPAVARLPNRLRLGRRRQRQGRHRRTGRGRRGRREEVMVFSGPGRSPR